MTNDKWQDLIFNVEEKFGLTEHITEADNMEDDMGHVIEGKKESIVFQNDLGKIKIERISHPIITDKKMHYHKGSGGTAKVEYIVSDTETTAKLKAYIEKDGEWEELDIPAGSMNF